MAFLLKIDRGINGLNHLADSWKELVSKQNVQHFFHSWWYYFACLKALNNIQDDRFLFISAIENGKALAVLPVETSVIRRAGLSVKILGSPRSIYIPYWDWIGEPGSNGKQILQNVFNISNQYPEIAFDIMQFNGVLEDSSFRKAVAELTGQKRLIREKTQPCNYIYCDSLKDQLSSLSRNFRGNLRKAKNKLQELTGVTFTSVKQGQNLQEAFMRFVKLEASGWKGINKSAILNNPDILRFYKYLLNQYGHDSEGECWINELLINNHTISSQFCLRMKDNVYIFKIAYDETCKKVAPGNMLLKWMIKECCNDSSTRYLNLISDSAWHSDWKPRSLSCEEIKYYSSSAKGTALWLRKKISTFIHRQKTNT